MIKKRSDDTTLLNIAIKQNQVHYLVPLNYEKSNAKDNNGDNFIQEPITNLKVANRERKGKNPLIVLQRIDFLKPR